jgi:hypothetical protein
MTVDMDLYDRATRAWQPWDKAKEDSSCRSADMYRVSPAYKALSHSDFRPTEGNHLYHCVASQVFCPKAKLRI